MFHLGHTLGSGQVFRWGRDGDGWWKGVAYGTAFHLRQVEGQILFRASSGVVNTYTGDLSVADFLIWYLRLAEAPRVRVPRNDKWLRKARDLMRGLRFVRQDPFECIISYILSVQAHMTLTKRRLNFIAQTFGDPLAFLGETYWVFPSPICLAIRDGAFFRRQRFGWRSERVALSARFVAEALGGQNARSVSLEAWREMADALYETPNSGVGLKVARCIDLFSLDRLCAVPVDTWVRKFAADWYGVTGSDAKICAWGEQRWGRWAGYCNEYLFAYYRELHGETIYDRVISFAESDDTSAELPFDRQS